MTRAAITATAKPLIEHLATGRASTRPRRRPAPVVGRARGAGAGRVEAALERALDRRDEPIAAPGHRFDEPRRRRVLAERLAQAFDRGVEAVIELDERVVGPQLLPQLLTRDHLTGAIEQRRRGSAGAGRSPKPRPPLAQLARADVQLEHPEREPGGRCRRAHVHTLRRASPESNALRPSVPKGSGVFLREGVGSPRERFEDSQPLPMIRLPTPSWYLPREPTTNQQVTSSHRKSDLCEARCIALKGSSRDSRATTTGSNGRDEHSRRSHGATCDLDVPGAGRVALPTERAPGNTTQSRPTASCQGATQGASQGSVRLAGLGRTDARLPVPATGLAASWPAAGPPRLWTRPLGEGFSAAAVEGNRLYTMYSTPGWEIVAALDAATGKTVWEYAYETSLNEGAKDVGAGPYAMPQVIGDRVVSVGGTGKLYSLDKRTGKPVWSHDLLAEFGGDKMTYGYSCHALPYKNLLIMLVGGASQSIVAFDQADGRLVWGKHAFNNAHSSPVLIEVDGQEQVVALMRQQVVAFDPNSGALLWEHPHPTEYLGITTPIWGADNILVVSSPTGGHTRASPGAAKRTDDRSGALAQPASPGALRQPD